MNLKTQFDALYPQEIRAPATLSQQTGGIWLAYTQGGTSVYLKGGSGFSAGQKVWYDTATLRILEAAPDVVITDCPLY